jgi:hypothetical protein
MKQCQAFYKLPLAILGAVVLTMLKNEKVSAFSIDVLPDVGNANLTPASYTWSVNGKNGNGVVTLKDYVPAINRNLDISRLNAEYARGTTKLNDQDPTQYRYTFRSADTDLNGQFRLLKYYPCTPQTASACLGLNDIVGAKIEFFYVPGQGDPAGNQSYFIQLLNPVPKVKDKEVIFDNSPTGQGGDFENTPVYPFQKEYPLKDKIARFFEDTPNIDEVTKPHDWAFRVYLATDTIPHDENGNVKLNPDGTVPIVTTLYNGMSWGWSNTFTPPPGDGGNPGGDPGGGYGGGYGAAALEPLSADGFAFAPDLQVNASSAAAPEPTTIVGAALAIGAWTGVSWRKRKKLKP